MISILNNALPGNRREYGMSNRNLSLDSDVATVLRNMPEALKRHSPPVALGYGVEVLKPQGWVPLAAGFFSSKVKKFETKDAAIEACIAHWQKSGLAARPFQFSL